MRFSGIYRERGKVLEANLQQRQRVSRKLAAHKARRKTNEREAARLRRELSRLVIEARSCKPPMIQDEISRLSGVHQTHVSRIIRESEMPNLEELKGAESA